jgi:hypothetical protein
MVTSLPTIVFVDVDGVINADIPLWPTDTHRRADVFIRSIRQAQRIDYSTDVVDGLRAIEAMPGVEMKWLTTWQYAAADDLAPVIGVGSGWPVMVEPMTTDGLGNPYLDWWKADVVRDSARAGQRVVWIDDDIVAWQRLARIFGKPERLEWITPESVFTVCPSSMHGLEPRHFADIAEFIAAGAA